MYLSLELCKCAWPRLRPRIYWTSAVIEFHEALYESELASYVRDEGKSEWRSAGVGRVQQCGRFPARGPLFAGSATMLYVPAGLSWAVGHCQGSLAVPARAATGYAGSATF